MQIHIFLLLYLLRSLPIKGGICYRPDTADEICCANFEDVDGTCIECRNGTYSNKGESCKECENGFYGKNCVEECGCQNNERCNKVLGCIVITETAIECPAGTYSDQSKICQKCANGYYGKKCIEKCDCEENERCDREKGCLNTSLETIKCPIGTVLTGFSICVVCPKPFYGNDCIYRCSCLHGQICDNVHGCLGSTTTTYRFNTTCEGKEDNDTVAFYTGGAGLLVMGFLIGILFTGVKHKYCSRQRVSEQNNEERQYPTEGSIEMHRYEYIDEEHMTDQTRGIVPPRLPVLRKYAQHQYNDASDNDYTDSIDGQNAIGMEDEGYLNPYQPIQETNIYKHEYKAIDAEYLHPYNSLLKHAMSEGHEYKDLRKTNIKSELKSSKSNKFQSYV